jgi:hypothetical protein
MTIGLRLPYPPDRHIAIHVVWESQIDEFPILLDAELVDRRDDSIGLHFHGGPDRVIVKHKPAVGLYFMTGGIDVSFDSLVLC